MGKLYVGLAVADSMYPKTCVVRRQPLTVEEVKNVMSEATSCCNASHANTLAALQTKHEIEVSAQGAPKVNLEVGDRIIVLSVRGLPRLEGTSQYTDEQIAQATFEFGMWTVLE